MEKKNKPTKTVKPINPKDKTTLELTVEEAMKAEGILVTFTIFDSKKKGAELKHSFITYNFPKGDISLSLDKVNDLLKLEVLKG